MGELMAPLQGSSQRHDQPVFPSPVAPTHPADNGRPGPPIITSIAWNAPADMDLRSWLEHGRRFGLAGRASGWWIGDWLNYGAQRYGEKYSRAARVTGYDVQTLMNMAYVASRFEISRRRETLSWSHHAEVAPLEPADQERWLEVAAQERLSVRCLRTEIRRERTLGSSKEAIAKPEATADTGDAICPTCGSVLAQPVASGD
jgi:hypothetical protein